MKYLFEYSDKLNQPVEVFEFNTEHNSFPIRPHWHYFCEILYMLEGTALISCDDRDYTLEVGDMIFIHPQVIHSIYSKNSCQLKYLVMKFDINQMNFSNNYTPKLSNIFKKAKEDLCASVYFSKNRLENVNAEKLFRDCITELKWQCYGYDLIVNSYICKLMIELVRIWRDNGFSTDNVLVNNDEDTSIHSITEYIDEHSDEPLKVEDMAAKCNMSYSYFAKNFKEIYGQSCKEYMEFVKVSKAENLLLFTSFDLSYISQETGFSDCSHLIKVFKKHKGITPKQFRIEKSGQFSLRKNNSE